MHLPRLSLRLRIAAIFGALGAGSVVAIIGATWWDQARGGAGWLGAAVAGFAVLGLIVWVWVLFDDHVAKPIERLSGAMRARSHADVAARFPTDIGPYLGDLPNAAADVTTALVQTRHDLTQAVMRETRRLQLQRDRLQALLADVPVGVVLCSVDHQVVFYNGQAVDFLGGNRAGDQGLGLRRGVFDYLHAGPIVHAYSRLQATQDPDAASDLLCSTVAGGAILAARMRLLTGEQGQAEAGYVLTLRDVSADVAAHRTREDLIDALFDQVRRPAAALQSLIGVLTDPAGPVGEARDRVRLAAQSEAGGLARAIHHLQDRHEAGRAEWWPLAMIRASDLGDAVRARIESRGGALMPVASALMLRCDGFELVALYAALEAWLRDGRDGFRLEISEDGTGAMLALEWMGPAVSIAMLEDWLDQPLDMRMADLTGQAVLTTHASTLWPEEMSDGRARLCLPLREARRATARPTRPARAVVYDFDLLSQGPGGDLAQMPLDQLTYVVFDTETTGLRSDAGDEIVQIAAQRIVNARRVEAEMFDTLVNPGRDIPAASTKIHGITNAMVQDAPTIAEVGRRFHRFAHNAVLVAHNAPFDIGFLRLKEPVIGQKFTHPVLDTVLLSAVVFGQSEDHSLDALTHRLGITIPEEARHTALGDTLATSEAFLRLLPALQARGLTRFGPLIEELRKHGRLLQDLNR
ncbi:DNA polymerase III subunit epsilon [Thioclava sp. SK-1]|uniref:3'-5' exonuclease n=1 Tax=Thioclava sp. SK-1 TaxID=1889770 RepID=UPI000825328E|nr:exonuclease domain-containing protein [Thioclava sp. SK-1]OCX64485.1 DNA polymerase III subunit epsilon [Thioclava sp. SK-1]